MKKLVLALALAAAVSPALAQMPGGTITPVITPAIVNTSQPPTPPNPQAPAQPPRN